MPKLYLKGFVSTPGSPFIWVYKSGEDYRPGTGKISSNPYRHSIAKITVRDFYAYPEGDGLKDFESYENFLEKLEKPADRTFKKLRARESITPDEKQIFCIYIAQMLKRVPAYRKRLNVMAANVAANYELPEEAIEKFKLPATDDTRRKVREIALRISREKEFPTRTHLRTLSSIPSSLVVNVLSKMSWRFFIAPSKHSFLTGDDPVFFTKRIGLNKADSEVSFPISSEICLVATNRAYRTAFIDASTQIAKELNRRTASNASEYLYSPQCEQWIVSLFNKDEHILHKIY